MLVIQEGVDLSRRTSTEMRSVRAVRPCQLDKFVRDMKQRTRHNMTLVMFVRKSCVRLLN